MSNVSLIRWNNERNTFNRIRQKISSQTHKFLLRYRRVSCGVISGPSIYTVLLFFLYSCSRIFWQHHKDLPQRSSLDYSLNSVSFKKILRHASRRRKSAGCISTKTTRYGIQNALINPCRTSGNKIFVITTFRHEKNKKIFFFYDSRVVTPSSEFFGYSNILAFLDVRQNMKAKPGVLTPSGTG